MTLTNDAKARKNTPMARGLLDYFPDALAEVARLSQVGSEQHNPGEPMRWDRTKSEDHPDCILRHLVDRGTLDTDGIRHSTKVAWRALAQLQLELEDAQKDSTTVGVFIDGVLYPVAEPETEAFDSGKVNASYEGEDYSASLNGWIQAYQDYEDSRS